MMNRPNSKRYRKDRRAKRSNPLLVWLLALLAFLIMVPIQAADQKEASAASYQETLPEETLPEETLPQE